MRMSVKMLVFSFLFDALYGGKGTEKNIQNYGSLKLNQGRPSEKKKQKMTHRNVSTAIEHQYRFNFSICNESALQDVLHSFTPWNRESNADCLIKILSEIPSLLPGICALPCYLCKWNFNGNETTICSLFPSHTLDESKKYQICRGCDSTANKPVFCALFVRWRRKSNYFLFVLNETGAEILFYAKAQSNALSVDSDDAILHLLTHILLTQSDDWTEWNEASESQTNPIELKQRDAAYALLGILCGYALIFLVFYNSHWLKK